MLEQIGRRQQQQRDRKRTDDTRQLRMSCISSNLL
jgi:hypothetical protein